MDSVYYLLILAFIGSVAGLIGGVLFLVKEEWCRSLSSIATPLAAGVLLSLALLDLLPEAVHIIEGKAFTVVLIVFVLAFLVEKFLLTLHHHDHHAEEYDDEHTVSFVILGDTIHNFLDGIAIGAAFVLNPVLGTFVAFATFLHETPHEIADFGILVNKGWSPKRAFVANFFSALATFPGAILTYIYANKIESGVGIFMAIAAGLFLYVSTTDFLPEIRHNKEKSSLTQALFLIIGILMIVILGTIFPEVHSN